MEAKLQNPILTPGMDAVFTNYGLPNTGNNSPVAGVKIVGNQLGAPHGSNWVPPPKIPAITNWNYGTMGQVFGIAIDNVGNVYFSTTAMYWGSANNMSHNPQKLADLNVVPSGAGGEGYHISGGGAGIYKADKLNLNTVTVLTQTVNASSGGGIGTNKIPNTGFGIGNIAVNNSSNSLYASNLEDGKLYCINLANGNITDVFDPFLPDASGAQIAGYGERIFGLGINIEATETRLYYAVLMSNNQTDIWSVRINTVSGAFLPLTNSIEIKLPASFAKTYVSDIAFSMRGEMLIAEKGDPHNAKVYQYFGKHNAWSLPQQLYMASFPLAGVNSGKNSAGGVDYGYSMKSSAVGNQISCDSIIWTQSNAIRDNNGVGFWAYGLLSHPLNGYTNQSTYLNEAYVVDLDAATISTMEKGSFGDVECYDWQCSPAQTNICSKTEVKLTRVATGECCYKVEISNKFRPDYFTAISISSSNLSIESVTKDISCTWANITFQSPTQVVFTKKPFVNGVPTDSLNLMRLLGNICFSGSGAGNITVNFIGNAPQNDVACAKTLTIQGCVNPIEPTCVSVIDLKAECVGGATKMKFKIKNNSAFTIRGLTLYSQNPNVTTVPKFIPVTDILPGQTSLINYEVPLVITNNANSACFFFAACDQNTTPGIAGPYPNWCCMDSIRYCVTLPVCNPCDGIVVSAEKNDPTKCCYDLTLVSNYNTSPIEYIEFNGVGGTQFALLSGWTIVPPVSSNRIKIKAPGGGITPGTYPKFASFCLMGTSLPPHKVSMKFFNAAGIIACTKEITMENCQLVVPKCANIINDSLYCDGPKIKYTFFVKNNAPFALHHIDFRTGSGIVLDKKFVLPNPPIPIGGIAGPYTVSVDSLDKTLDKFCIYLTAHNAVYDTISGIGATLCCTDSLNAVCLPMLRCEELGACCQWSDLEIPNGITPNNDGINDAYVIKNSQLCETISILVYNRWGNIVFDDANYDNKWEGTNKNGEKLPQGTYYVKLTLPNGSSKATFVDIRY